MFVGIISFSPELALIVANILMLPARLQQKLFLALEEKKLIAKDTYEFVFNKPHRFSFKPGQYLEWMLPHKESDSKGVRRYFTIASSPTEDKVRVAMKILDGASSYKEAIQNLDVAHPLIASQLAGDFLLPEDREEKLGFIAGGIGVTPFRSHVRYMLDSGQSRKVVLYYCVNSVAELAYSELWAEAGRKLDFTYVPVVAKEEVVAPHEKGYVTAELIKRRTPDYLERTWYISGPPGMVNAYKKLLKEMKVKGSRIKIDFFPGAV
jgi:ferredoxin-NADP reductase